jgi:hypothetical protein
MSDRPRTICPTCRVAIEPDETDVVVAEQIKWTPGQGDAAYDTAPGIRDVFHESCFDDRDPNYRRL